MTTTLTRRGILKALGIGAAAALIEEPVRKLWFVGSNAPVGSRIEHLGDSSAFNRYVERSFKLQLDLALEEEEAKHLDWRTATTWRMQLHVTEESAFRPRANEVVYSPIRGFRDDVDLPPPPDEVSTVDSPWWQEQIDNLERSRRRPTQEHSSYWLQDEHKAWTSREGYKPPISGTIRFAKGDSESAEYKSLPSPLLLYKS